MRQGLRLSLVCAGLAGPAQAQDTLSPFVEDVLTHVLLHELGHALIREFDLPVLANEEDMADSFATAYITSFADDPVRIITARTASWFFEADETENIRLQSEHAPDLRRAYRTLCMLYGTSPADYEALVAPHLFSERDLADCGEIAEQKEQAWIKVLTPHLAAAPSSQVAVTYEDGVFLAAALRSSGTLEQVATIARRFDWPHQITFTLRGCNGGGTANWNKSTRTITLCDSYIDRFQSQDGAIN